MLSPSAFAATTPVWTPVAREGCSKADYGASNKQVPYTSGAPSLPDDSFCAPAHRRGMMQNMKHFLPLCAVVLSLTAAAAAQEKPLPSPETLRERAVQQAKDQEKQRERYLCRVRVETTQLDGKGGEKKAEIEEREIFFVKRRQINQTVMKNGKPLSPGDAKKEIDRVKKQIEEAEQGKNDPNAIAQSDIVRLVKLSNERRILAYNRPTIVFDVVGDPKAKANNVAERAVEAMEGTAAIDEATGRIMDTNVHGIRDVKVGGGLVANLHKGFQLHVISAPQNDGVWLVKEVWGSGDARVGLFMHPSYKYHQVTESCRLFNVEADSAEKLQEAH
jgi:hypothetical protein